MDKTEECYQLVVTLSHSFQLNCRITSPSPYQVKETIAIYRENKIISQGLYSYDYTLFTAQTLIEKKTLSCKNISLICLFKSSDFKVEDKAWLDYPVLCIVFQIKVHIFLVTRRWRWAKEKKNLVCQQCLFSYGRNSSSSTLMTLAGMEGSGCSSTSDPNHLARPRGGLPPCCWEPFIRWGPWLCD